MPAPLAKAIALGAWAPDTDNRNAVTVNNVFVSENDPKGNQQWYHLLNGATPEVVKATQKRLGEELKNYSY